MPVRAAEGRGEGAENHKNLLLLFSASYGTSKLQPHLSQAGRELGEESLSPLGWDDKAKSLRDHSSICPPVQGGGGSQEENGAGPGKATISGELWVTQAPRNGVQKLNGITIVKVLNC